MMKNVEIECACGCGIKLNKYDAYGRERRFISGHNRRIYQDNKQYKREWNHRNRKNRYLYKKQFISNRKLKLITMLGGCCQTCGIIASNENLAIFDFHHKKSSEKDFNLGQNTIGDKAFSVVVQEAQKCEVLCSNCHRLYHYNNGIL